MADIVHIGLLSLSEPDGRRFIDELICKAHKNGKLISIDVNYRDDLFDSKQETIKLYKKYIDVADIVKCSEDELPVFTEGKK